MSCADPINSEFRHLITYQTCLCTLSLRNLLISLDLQYHFWRIFKALLYLLFIHKYIQLLVWFWVSLLLVSLLLLALLFYFLLIATIINSFSLTFQFPSFAVFVTIHNLFVIFLQVFYLLQFLFAFIVFFVTVFLLFNLKYIFLVEFFAIHSYHINKDLYH